MMMLHICINLRNRFFGVPYNNTNISPCFLCVTALFCKKISFFIKNPPIFLILGGCGGGIYLKYLVGHHTLGRGNLMIRRQVRVSLCHLHGFMPQNIRQFAQ